jgi:hypothetical protein
VPDDRFIVAQFCDDVRQEAGNKYSLMGCYSTDLLMPAFPFTLPKFCVQVKILTPVEKPFEKLAIRILRDDAPLAEMNIDGAGIRQAEGEKMPGAKWMVASVILQMSPFGTDGPATLRIEAETESGVIRSGGFRIKLLESPAQNAS